MSREIKFRAWDKVCCRFEYFEIGENDDCYGMFRVAANKFGSVVEQYTGLLDRNGTPIYEGDVIQEEIDCGDDDIDGVYRYKVVWDEETLCWSLCPNYGAIHKDLWETNTSREVIGNIHESNMEELCPKE